MSEDLKLITKVNLNDPPAPPQTGNPTEYFGERSNDIQFDTVNDFERLTGLAKLKQDINKILLTAIGRNIGNELYGTELQTLVGNKINLDYTKAKIKDDVIGALQVLQYINRENDNLDERPEILQFLSITELNPTQFEIQLSVVTASGKDVATGLTVTIQ